MSRVLLAMSVLATACSSSKQASDFEVLAEAINPTLRALRPTAIAIRTASASSDAASVRAVVAMCSSVDRLLVVLPLHRRQFDDTDHAPAGPDFSVSDAARNAAWLVESRSLYCKGRDWNDDLQCRDWCVERWTKLVTSIDAQRERAQKHGVYIEPLK